MSLSSDKILRKHNSSEQLLAAPGGPGGPGGPDGLETDQTDFIKAQFQHLSNMTKVGN